MFLQEKQSNQTFLVFLLFVQGKISFTQLKRSFITEIKAINQSNILY